MTETPDGSARVHARIAHEQVRAKRDERLRASQEAVRHATWNILFGNRRNGENASGAEQARQHAVERLTTVACAGPRPPDRRQCREPRRAKDGPARDPDLRRARRTPPHDETATGATTMGWITTSVPRDEEAFVRDLYTWQDEKREVHPIAMARRGRAWYLACEEIRTPDATRTVWAGICLISRDRNDPGYEFGYRTDDESVGPNETQCPQRILKLLTPTDHTHSRRWRERCRAWHDQQREARRNQPREGEWIEFESPLRFANGHEEKRFRVRRIKRRNTARRRSTLLESPDGTLYCVSRLSTRTDWHPWTPPQE